MVNINKIKKPGQKAFSMYVEIIAIGETEEEVIGVVEDILDENFGVQNYITYQTVELTEEEIAEYEAQLGDDDPTEDFDDSVLEKEVV